MCGIVGSLNASRGGDIDIAAMVRSMAARLQHRGPDDGGTWVDGAAGIALGHRRLAIVDLSAAGHQPMVSPSGRYVLAFNGEIYNHLQLREEIDAQGCVAWHGHSDTETLLALFDRHDVSTALEKTVGMFALALWDRRERVLTLARDRLGEKPLYYGWQGDTFLFGSELKALRAHPAFAAAVDRDVASLYVRYGFVPAPYSIFQGVFKLPAGCFLRLPASATAATAPRVENYWSLRDVAHRGIADPHRGNDEEAVAELEHLLSQSVAGQRIADVPLGAFLSGGIDSSTIVALMQSQASRPVKTFTVGFHEARHNEAEHASAVARHLGTDHLELFVTPREALDVIPQLPTLYDEPFGDSSAIPTHLISKLARQHVTVALSGDGGDEFFAGYNRYQRTQRLWTIRERIPKWARRIAAGVIASAPDAATGFVNRFPLRRDRPCLEQRAATTRQYLGAVSMEQFYQQQLSSWARLPLADACKQEPPFVMNDPSSWLAAGGLYERMMYIDGMSYLPDDILVKVDRASMGVNLETRVPLLDHRVVEYAWRLPLSMKVRDGQGKWLLRQVLYRYVPKELVERPKAGFAVPIGEWIRRELRDWAEDLLSEKKLARGGLFATETVRKTWRWHLQRKCDMGLPLWQVLCFQAWLDAMNSPVTRGCAPSRAMSATIAVAGSLAPGDVVD